jgi:hypothetical protein
MEAVHAITIVALADATAVVVVIATVAVIATVIVVIAKNANQSLVKTMF